MKQKFQNNIARPVNKRFLQFSSSLYGRVVFVIALLAIFIFLAIGLIFRSVYGGHLEKVIQQNTNNVSSIVEGALYHSMLENDYDELQNTLDVINTMSGVDEVNMYDKDNTLVFASYANINEGHSNPDCIRCHTNFDEMFSSSEKSYRIIELESECIMSESEEAQRHLMIRTPVFNQPSCYTAECHAHSQEEDILGYLIIKSPLNELDNVVQKTTTEFFILSVLSTALLLLVIILFTRKEIQKPLNKLVKASISVANGDHTTRLPAGPHQLKDIYMVSSAFNNMMDSLQAATVELENWSQQLEYKVQKKSEELSAAQNELINIERIASLGKLSASVAHEINNPLSGILVYTKLTLKQLNNNEITPEKREAMMKHLKFIESETKRCGDIVKGLLEFSRKDQNDFETGHLNTILKDTCKIVYHSIKMANIRFITNYEAANDAIHCSSAQIKQAFVAILVNAREAITQQGEIVLQTRNIGSDKIQVEVSDNGIGISKENLSHIFEPFYSTKNETSGIGLGLAIVHGILQNHEATIEVDSNIGKGTTFRVIFPIKNQQG